MIDFSTVKGWTIPDSGIQRDVLRVTRNNVVLWEKQTGPDYTEPFYVENINNTNETLRIVKQYSSAPTLTIEYSTDKTNWNTLGSTSNTALTRTVAPGERLYLKCNANKFFSNRIYGTSKVGGNIMSLLYGRNFTGNETSFPNGSTNNFKALFYGNTRLINASELLLPATTLASYCYSDMFHDCTSLASAPVLPATTLADNCYDNMFDNCTSLTSAPVLPATTLALHCYWGMFSGCTSLTTAPVLPATTLTTYCYYYMFSGCTSLTTAPVLPATTLVDECYNGMFYGCTSLTTAPVLPATTLASYCYKSMFYNCTSLASAPVLPATTLANNCYDSMFYGCTSLNEVTCYATSGINEKLSTDEWLKNVASNGTFTKAARVTWPTGENGIPSGWTVVNV